MKFGKKTDHKHNCTLCTKYELLARSYKYIQVEGVWEYGLVEHNIIGAQSIDTLLCCYYCRNMTCRVQFHQQLVSKSKSKCIELPKKRHSIFIQIIRPILSFRFF
jgi:hypothetical protein